MGVYGGTLAAVLSSYLPLRPGGIKIWVVCFQFEGQAGEEFQEQASQLCSQHSQAVELIKNKKRKDPRFAQIIQVRARTRARAHALTLVAEPRLCASRAAVTLAQECEASPHCRRMQLKDLLVSEMQRITKYPLLLDKIIKHTEGQNLGNNIYVFKEQMLAKVCGFNPFYFCSRRTRPPLAAACSGVLQRDPTDHQRGCQGNRAPPTAEPIPTQARRCPSVQGGHMVDSDPPASHIRVAYIKIHPSSFFSFFFCPVSQNLDFSTKRMIHEGPLTWKVSKDKQIGEKDIFFFLIVHMSNRNIESFYSLHQRFKRCCCPTAWSSFRGAPMIG